ncbi:hypothetical protein CIG75_09205 [Tumebacillus algifaecis]|uniref:Uncharacterized protein n=1 Tax=Tumebacillus algifaecis TaxID=1214604 RepID=A0A223D0K3_9BACL|nr:hypothetical protein [Tumebacillus algifaecis]ASS75140.1 hypothetical protein CIG75_09205 [Tumebacillus algifaecis]
MKKWVLAWAVFTAYLVTNLTIMQSAEQPHLVATLLLGFFFYLIFGIRGVYGAAVAVILIVLLAVVAHQMRHPNFVMIDTYAILIRLVLDLVTILGGGGLGYWLLRLLNLHTAK